MSSDSSYQVHFKRSSDLCFVNNYNPVSLKARQAKLDLQPVYDYYTAVSYMAAYFSKSETDTTEAMKHAVDKIRTQSIGNRKAMYKLAKAFISARQFSL